MAAVFPVVGLIQTLDQLVGNLPVPLYWVVHLFQNDLTPHAGTVIGDLVEADFTGYAAQPITAWGAAVPDGLDGAQVEASPIDFVCSAAGPPQPIYGAYVTDALGNLIWVDRDPAAPRTIANVNDTVSYAPLRCNKNVV